jgi:hypothetical protein
MRRPLSNARPPSHPFGSSAVLGSFVASQVRRRGGGEDPWLCGPGFHRVCRYRWYGAMESTATLGSGTATVKNAGHLTNVSTVAYSQVGDSPYGPTVTILAIDGTPDPLIRNSMYGPGGARLPLAGALVLRVVVVPAGLVKVR